MPTREEVPVHHHVVYTHRFGIDIFNLWTEEEAIAKAQALAVENAPEFRINEPKWSEWLELTGGEENLEVA